MSSSISDLPESIIWEILSRLLFDAIFPSRCVCEMWLDITVNPEFKTLLSSRLSPCILITTENLKDIIAVRSIETKDDVDFSSEPNGVRTIKPNFLKLDKNPKLVINTPADPGFKYQIASCRGLICFCPRNYFGDFYVLNPFTGEKICIPNNGPEGLHHYEFSNFGFGYCTETNKYKLLRIFGALGYTDYFDILTLGDATGSWRRVETGFKPTNFDILGLPDDCLKDLHEYAEFHISIESFYLEGCSHWGFICDVNSLLSFDFTNERFSSIPIPSDIEDIYTLETTIGPLGGCLSICQRTTHSDFFDVWVMKEYGVKESWTKEYSIDTTTLIDWLHPFDIIRCQPIHVLSNGEVLMLLNYKIWVLYNPSQNLARAFKTRGLEEAWTAICFQPKFVSLEDAITRGR